MENKSKPTKPFTEDLIRQPDHYARFKIEPADYAMDNNLPHHVGSIVKYVTRAGHKLYPDCNALQSERIDLEKAMDWAAKRIKKIDQVLIQEEMNKYYASTSGATMNNYAANINPMTGQPYKPEDRG